MKPDVYVSDDGGYTWIKALDGPHHYAILDSGGLLVAVEHKPTTTINQIKWVTVRGNGGVCVCWCLYFSLRDLYLIWILFKLHALQPPLICFNLKFLHFSDFPLMKDSAGTFTTSAKSPSTSLGWHQSRELAPWTSVSGATESPSWASTGSPSPSTSGISSPETVSDMTICLIPQTHFNALVCQYFVICLRLYKYWCV